MTWTTAWRGDISTGQNRQQPPVAYPYLLATVPSPERLLSVSALTEAQGNNRNNSDSNRELQVPGVTVTMFCHLPVEV